MLICRVRQRLRRQLNWSGENNEKPPIIVEVDQDGHLGISVDDQEMQRGLGLNELLTRVRAEMQLNPESAVLGWRRCSCTLCLSSSKPSMHLIRRVLGQ